MSNNTLAEILNNFAVNSPLNLKIKKKKSESTVNNYYCENFITYYSVSKSTAAIKLKIHINMSNTFIIIMEKKVKY